MGQVLDLFNQVKTGNGWATEQIIQFTIELNYKQRFTLLMLLADEGLLFDSEVVTEEDCEHTEVPKNGQLTTDEVIRIYSFLLTK